MLNPREDKDLEKWGQDPPEHIPHGSDDDIRKNMIKMTPGAWRQDGNRLIGDTDLGEVVTFIPTDMMLVGTDDRGLPILKKVLE